MTLERETHNNPYLVPVGCNLPEPKNEDEKDKAVILTVQAEPKLGKHQTQKQAVDGTWQHDPNLT